MVDNTSIAEGMKSSYNAATRFIMKIL